MRKIKEVLRLRFELKLGQRPIARSCSISQATVHEYLRRAGAAGLSWPLTDDWDDTRLERALFGPASAPVIAVQRSLPDFAAVHEQLKKHRHVTLRLVWEEYRQTRPDGYGYSFFCELYQQWRRKLDVVLRQDHVAGEKLFVDWAGMTIPLHDPITGRVSQASLFVAVLGASSYTYAEATGDQQMEAWIQAHVHGLEFFGGAPRLVVPDNAKTGRVPLSELEVDAQEWARSAAAVDVILAAGKSTTTRQHSRIRILRIRRRPLCSNNR